MGGDTRDGGNSGLSITIKLNELYFLSLHLMIVKINLGLPKNSQKNFGRKLNLEFDPYLNSPRYVSIETPIVAGIPTYHR